MRWQFTFFLAIGLISSFSFAAYAQPGNNTCQGAIELPEVRDWCSQPRAYTIDGATESGYGAATCFTRTARDVWFSFVPIATDVTITIIGNTPQGSGGTLARPEAALYLGDCGGTLNQQTCETDNENNSIVELYKGGLVIGQRYYIRVQGRNNTTGSFQLCISNYNPPAEPTGDCFAAAILCDKESFVVQQVIGAGLDPTEANDAPCLNQFPGNVETNSTWFTWTADNDGTLTFTLTPLNPADDLDFVLYRLPEGPLNCARKQVVRCMASGDFFFPSRCMGPTGLREGETDIAEPPGCNDPRQNNFLRPLDMRRGETYALVVNNFSSTGNGFRVEFGGTGQFQGPKAAFAIDPAGGICVGGSVTITDASSFALGNISDWEWSFGPEATPATITGRGPHQVSFASAGVKSIVLTVESEQGCRVTEVGNIIVECCEGHFSASAALSDLRCPDDNSGRIDLSVSNPYGPYRFSWSNGQSSQVVSGLSAGQFTVTVSDAARCDTTLTFTLAQPSAIEVDTVLQMPTCDGGADGAITLQARGGTPGYTFNWQGAGFGSDNSLRDVGRGQYGVIVRDANNCELSLSINLQELQLLLDPSVQAVRPPSCTGFSDGAITVQVANSSGPFQYDWQDGRGFQGQNSLLARSAGVYTVEVVDANLCRGSFTFDMQDPPPLGLELTPADVSCHGDSDGRIVAVAEGGVGGYTYRWSNGQTQSAATQLAVGQYSITVLDANSCEITGSAAIGQPDPVDIAVIDLQNLLCNAQPTGSVTVEGRGGVGPYEYSVDGVFFQVDPRFANLPAGDYEFTVMDANGCVQTTKARLTEPVALFVDAGQDQTIQLGQDARLRAIASQNGVRFEWTPGNTLNCVECPNPIARPTSTTSYTIVIRDDNNCEARDSVTISVSPIRPLYIPSGFSPNGDGINDYFTLFGGPGARQILLLRIFDRWGELVFETRNAPLGEEVSGWDGTLKGKPMNPNVFVYYAEVEFIDGAVVVYTGDLTLAR